MRSSMWSGGKEARAWGSFLLLWFAGDTGKRVGVARSTTGTSGRARLLASLRLTQPTSDEPT